MFMLEGSYKPGQFNQHMMKMNQFAKNYHYGMQNMMGTGVIGTGVKKKKGYAPIAGGSGGSPYTSKIANYLAGNKQRGGYQMPTLPTMAMGRPIGGPAPAMGNTASPMGGVMGPQSGGSPVPPGAQGFGGAGSSQAMIKDMIGQYQTQHDKANAANEARYNELKGLYDNRQSQGMNLARNSANQEYRHRLAASNQDLVNRGLRASGLANSNAHRAHEQSQAMVMNQFNQLSGDKLAMMERKNENGPNLNMMAQLAMQAGQAEQQNNQLNGQMAMISQMLNARENQGNQGPNPYFMQPPNIGGIAPRINGGGGYTNPFMNGGNPLTGGGFNPPRQVPQVARNPRTSMEQGKKNMLEKRQKTGRDETLSNLPTFELPNEPGPRPMRLEAINTDDPRHPNYKPPQNPFNFSKLQSILQQLLGMGN